MKRAVLLESDSQCASPWVRVGEATEIVVTGMETGDLLDFFFRDERGERIQGSLSTHENGRMEINGKFKEARQVKAKHASTAEGSRVTVDLE